MSSTSSADFRPSGNHRAPRKRPRTLTNRRISIAPGRRAEIDLHYLGSALLRLAQEDYDAARLSLTPRQARQGSAHVGPHEPASRPETEGPPPSPTALQSGPHGAGA